MTSIDCALSAGARLGEGPVWDPDTDRLIWVDILGRAVHRFDPATGADTARACDRDIGAARPRAGGGLVANLRDGVALYDGTGPHDATGRFDWLARPPGHGGPCRGNDAAVDPWGRLWAGTMRYDEAHGGGALYRIAPDGTTETVLDDVTISNGLGWSPDRRAMYYVDTPTRRVDVFDVDPDDGTITARRPFAVLDAGVSGAPDGLTVDADGAVWVALFDGGAVHRYAPDGCLDRTLPLPVTRPTACAFGGPALRDLYITTATEGLPPDARAAQPLAGALLVLPDAGAGLPPTPFPA